MFGGCILDVKSPKAKEKPAGCNWAGFLGVVAQCIARWLFRLYKVSGEK